MTMTSKFLLLLVVLASSTVFGQSAQQSSSPAAQTIKTSASSVAQQHEADGSRIFEQNCSRCHNTPEGFSPRISGTIARHMRVRASLTKHDEEELLRFLNP